MNEPWPSMTRLNVEWIVYDVEWKHAEMLAVTTMARGWPHTYIYRLKNELSFSNPNKEPIYRLIKHDFHRDTPSLHPLNLRVKKHKRKRFYRDFTDCCASRVQCQT